MERQSLLRIQKDYYFPRMASSINSSAFQVVRYGLAEPSAHIIPGEDLMLQEIFWESEGWLAALELGDCHIEHPWSPALNTNPCEQVHLGNAFASDELGCRISL